MVTIHSVLKLAKDCSTAVVALPASTARDAGDDRMRRVSAIIDGHALTVRAVDFSSRDPFGEIIDKRICLPAKVTIDSPEYLVLRFTPPGPDADDYEARVERCVAAIEEEFNGQTVGIIRSKSVSLEECSFMPNEVGANYRGLIRRKPRRFR